MRNKLALLINNSGYVHGMRKVVKEKFYDQYEIVNVIPDGDLTSLLVTKPTIIIVSDTTDNLLQALEGLVRMKITPFIFGIHTNTNGANIFKQMGITSFAESEDKESVLGQLELSLEDFIDTTANIYHNENNISDITDALEIDENDIKEKKKLELPKIDISMPEKKVEIQYIKTKNKIITFHSPKGGAGTSLFATEFAYTLAKEAKRLHKGKLKKNLTEQSEGLNPLYRVCLIDFNASYDTIASSLSVIANAPSKINMVNMLQHIQECVNNSLSSADLHAIMSGEKQQADVLDVSKVVIQIENMEQLLLFDESTGLYILPAIPLLDALENIKPKFLDVLINNLKKFFDYIVIDTSSNISDLTVNALSNADDVYLVIPDNLVSMVVIGKFLKALSLVNVKRDKFKILLNSLNYANPSKWSKEDFAESIELEIVQQFPYDAKLQKVTEDQSVSAMQSASNHNDFNKEMRKLTRNCFSNLPEPKKSFFSLEKIREKAKSINIKKRKRQKRE